MEQRKYLLSQIKRLRKIDFYNNLSKLVLIVLFVLICPVLIYNKILLHEYFTVVFLIIAEVVFIVLAIPLFNESKEKYSLKNSRIIRCIEHPEIVTEIIITPNKILFEIKELEDESIFLDHSEYRNKIIKSIESIFINTRIVNNV